MSMRVKVYRYREKFDVGKGEAPIGDQYATAAAITKHKGWTILRSSELEANASDLDSEGFVRPAR